MKRPFSRRLRCRENLDGSFHQSDADLAVAVENVVLVRWFFGETSTISVLYCHFVLLNEGLAPLIPNLDSTF